MQREARITKGQVAAVCGLTIAGLQFRVACAVVAAPSKPMREIYMPAGWFGRSPTRDMDDRAWARVREAYEAEIERVDVLCRRFGIGEKTLYRHAERGNWRRRGAGTKMKPIAIKRLPQPQKLIYYKMRYIAGMSREDALAQAMR